MWKKHTHTQTHTNHENVHRRGQENNVQIWILYLTVQSAVFEGCLIWHILKKLMDELCELWGPHYWKMMFFFRIVMLYGRVHIASLPRRTSSCRNWLCSCNGIILKSLTGREGEHLIQLSLNNQTCVGSKRTEMDTSCVDQNIHIFQWTGQITYWIVQCFFKLFFWVVFMNILCYVCISNTVRKCNIILCICIVLRTISQVDSDQKFF